MNHSPRVLLAGLLMVLATALAGCTDGDVTVTQDADAPSNEAGAGDEQDQPSWTGDEASVQFQGTAGGMEEDTARCGEYGALAGGVQVGGGSVTIELRDGDGAVVYTTTVPGPGQKGIDTEIAGAPGTWSLEATRGAGFTGQYAVELAC